MYKLTKTNIAAFVTAVLAAIVVFALAMPASAYWSPRSSGDDNDIRVSVSNDATVTNTVEVEAETGDNEAAGGDGEEGGNGGEAEGSGDNTGGNGGNGGSGALGGLIQTGDAVAFSSVMNDVNYNETVVTDSCGCDEEEDGWMPFSFNRQSRDNGGDDNDIRVRVSNSANVMNDVEVEAETGDNEADGGDGEEGGNGGDAENEGNRSSRMMMPFFSFWSSDNNVGGNGGTGGNGGVGGEIYTGKATSGSEVVNVVNRNITRVTR